MAQYGTPAEQRPSGSTGGCQSYLVVIASRLRDPAHRDRFLVLSRQTEAWLAQRPGFLRYELFETDEGWMDTMLWASREQATAGNEEFLSTPIAHAFAEIVQPAYRLLGGSRVRL